MDPSLDDFITYDDQFTLKHTSMFDAEFTLSSPFSENSDSAGVFPPFLPKTIQNLLDPDVEPQTRNSIFTATQFQNEIQTQKLKDDKSQTQSESLETKESIQSPVYQEIEEVQEKKKGKSKLNPESKRITKREKAKDRTKAKKTSTEVLLQKADPKHIPKELEDPNLDDGTKKKMVQMIRNRISAQNSRDRKKFYIEQLEEMRDLLTEENSMLTSEKKALLEKLKKIEGDQELLIQEISTLKKSLPQMCSNCGFTIDFGGQNGNRNQETTEDNSSRERSGDSSPIVQRGTSRLNRGFFGFSMTFVALFCLFLGLSTNQYGGGSLLAGNVKTTNLVAIPRTLASQFDMGTCKKPEEIVVETADEATQTTNISLENLQTRLEEAEFGEDHILNKIRPLMDQFEKLHKNFYQTYETNKLVVDLSKAKIPDSKLLDAATSNEKNSYKNFLGKKTTFAPSNTTANRTSTLFCPTGFEFFKASSTAGLDKQTSNIDPSIDDPHKTLDSVSRTLDLEKAEYIQLVLPKQSIGRLGVTENSSEISNFPVFQGLEEQNSLIEVWCKVFAVRDFAASF